MLLVLTNTFTMKKRILLYTFLSILCCTVYAQKIDFNMTGRNEVGHITNDIGIAHGRRNHLYSKLFWRNDNDPLHQIL